MVSMVHLYCKSLASPERCMCEKEVIRTASASLIDRCVGAPGAQYVKRCPADLAVPGLSPTDGGNLFKCNQPFIISSSHRPE